MFPRLKGWGLIEATSKSSCSPSSYSFPRLKGWGLIEASLIFNGFAKLAQFPRLKGWGLIEAILHSLILRQPVRVSPPERVGPH